MANKEDQETPPPPSAADAPPQDEDPENDSDSDSDSDYYSDSSFDEADVEAYLSAFRNEPGTTETKEEDPETNFRDIAAALDKSEAVKRMHDIEDPEFLDPPNPFDFPKDPENWTEEDLRELWADAPIDISGTGWDPAFVPEDEWEYVLDEIAKGRHPPIAPFYLPYRKHYPAIPLNHSDINNPEAVIEELDRIEEFLKWVSYIFEDGST